MAFKVTFIPDSVTVEVAPGTSLRRAAAVGGIELKSVCGGEGTCGLCLVRVVKGADRARCLGGNVAPKRRREGYVPACQTLVEGDLVVEVPDFARLAEHRVLAERLRRGEALAEEETDLLQRWGLDPLVRRVRLSLDPPTLTENQSDWARLTSTLRRQLGAPAVTFGTGLDVLRRLPRVLREAGWEVDVWLGGWDDSLATPAGNGPGAPGVAADAPPRVSVVDLAPSRAAGPSLGLALDIGTTSVVASLVDLERGTTLGTRGTFNRQARYGDDVITRIIHAAETPAGLEELRAAAVESANELIVGLLRAAGARREDVRAVVAAGNTTMEHLFLGLPPDFIRLEPYIPAAVEFPAVRAGELGLEVNPEAWVRLVPSVASYVGGDITAGVLAVGLAERDEVTLFIDIGTNGEMVLGNREWMVACACSAGPCFEGGGVTHGMRAVPGAIERLEIGPDYEPRVETVGGLEPRGICGSGLVDAVAKLREAGVIDRAGKFQDVPSPRLRNGPDGPEFVLWRRESGASEASGVGEGYEIVITEADVKNIIRAKGAVYAGIRSLLAAVDLGLEAVSRIYIAGGFGNYLNLRDAVRIGMLPDLAPSRYRFVGNTSLKGARAALLSRRALEACRELAARMTYLELSVGRGFMEEFVSALFLPHTDLGQFPSVRD
ncbi:MAG: ASKHA domain-containing protein [Firmicutes bacterium]|nr:ASKHA domain-containing protein [Bacillota bacterium]